MVTYQMTLSFVHIYNFVAFTKVNFVNFVYYSLSLSLLIVHQVIQKIMSSLQIREFTGDLC